MTDLAVKLTITSILSRGARGGVIMAGVDTKGQRYVARCSWTLVPDSAFPCKGQRWALRGVLVDYKQEQQIEATQAELLRPSGKNTIAWIAGCNDIPGVGQVKAQRLYDRFGPELVTLIEQRDMNALSAVISFEAADLLCHAFEKFQVAQTLVWLDQIGMPRRIGQKVVACYAGMAREKIEANPYALISFEARWKAVDVLAKDRFGVTEEDPRRLEAAVEETLYRGLKDGHTCLPEKQVKRRLKTLLGAHDLVGQALATDGSSQYRRVGDLYQPTGTYLIELEIARRLSGMAAGEVAQQTSIFAVGEVDHGAIKAAIHDYERTQGFALSPEQRQAILCSGSACLSLILGGAGTGKTTVLKALYAALEAVQPGIAIYQLALAGRAAQRMQEATGRESCTIAAFFAQVSAVPLGSDAVVVIDEMSMVDAILFYRLLRHIPPSTRLILVGDPSQLPPIGPGLVLHALAAHPAVAQTELKVVKRQSDASGILPVAVAVRRHTIPDYASYQGRGNGVSFIDCPDQALDEAVVWLYAELGGSGEDYHVQILSMTRSNQGGVKHLNQRLHERYRHEAPPVYCVDPQFGVVPARTLEYVPLKVGDLVIFTKNDYTLGLRNGSLGRITEALPVEGEGSDCCKVDFEGVEHALKTTQLESLSHAYAITVHKSQGSQFSRVIVPIRRSRLLDQALIYTAITRAVDQVVLIGNREAATASILAQASAARRHVSLPRLLRESYHTKQSPILTT
ncbi:ATP-dependent RecD-like DNA helicase [Halomonas sp. G15]|uniref:AAA family ATPase n=1 Tax=Halomonas sp. G15 TaxID=2903521 RepID=UPI001E3D726A|nr:AAA family ATPase [Halomonas sp. G15]MCE0734583.1 ATP-dependent RecD-like DNA helicase [Halomonas sp. G15]